MTGSFATNLFRITFVLAGCYNLVFGIWAGYFPLRFFEIAGIEPPRYPAIWSCLGMVIGLYGFLYWYAAWKPEQGRAIIAIGLLGKVLGPIGMAASFSESWPQRLALLNIYNDVIWWLPFTLFLVRGTNVSMRMVRTAPWCCAFLHAFALIVMAMFLKDGMLTEPDVTLRATYIAEHLTLWAVGWIVWMASAISLVGFYAWWGSQLADPIWATIGVLIAALGLVFDLTGESLSVFVLSELGHSLLINSANWDSASFEAVERGATLLTAGAANLLYTLGGVVLMLRTRQLPNYVHIAMWVTWIAGLGMTVAAVANHVGGMVASTTILFPLLIAWIVWMPLRWRPA